MKKKVSENFKEKLRNFLDRIKYLREDFIKVDNIYLKINYEKKRFVLQDPVYFTKSKIPDYNIKFGSFKKEKEKINKKEFKRKIKNLKKAMKVGYKLLKNKNLKKIELLKTKIAQEINKVYDEKSICMTEIVKLSPELSIKIIKENENEK